MRPIHLMLKMLTIFLVSCQPDDPSPTSSSFGQIQLTADDQLAEEYQVNQQNHSVDVRYYQTGQTNATGGSTLLSRARYQFDAQRRLISSDHDGFYTACNACWTPPVPSPTPTSSWTTTYGYQNGSLVRAERQEIRDGQAGTVSREVFYTNAKGQLERVERLLGYFGPLTLFETFALQYDVKGNLRQRERFSATGFREEVVTYQYDDKPNPFQTLNLPDLEPRFLSPNNVINTYRRIFETADPPGTIRQSEQKVSYTYNSLDRPATINGVINESGLDRLWTVRYK